MLFRKAAEELGDALDRYSPEAAEAQKVCVAAHDDLRPRSDGALENPIVCRVSFDGPDARGRHDDPSDDTELSIGLGEPLGRAVSAMTASEMVRST